MLRLFYHKTFFSERGTIVASLFSSYFIKFSKKVTANCLPKAFNLSLAILIDLVSIVFIMLVFTDAKSTLVTEKSTFGKAIVILSFVARAFILFVKSVYLVLSLAGDPITLVWTFSRIANSSFNRLFKDVSSAKSSNISSTLYLIA